MLDVVVGVLGERDAVARSHSVAGVALTWGDFLDMGGIVAARAALPLPQPL
jgi:hypothetical protein